MKNNKISKTTGTSPGSPPCSTGPVKTINLNLLFFRDKLTVSNLTETRQKSNILFGNLDDIHNFHSNIFYPELERCGANPAAVGRTFLSHCSELRSLYSSYCQNMPSARQAISGIYCLKILTYYGNLGLLVH